MLKHRFLFVGLLILIMLACVACNRNTQPAAAPDVDPVPPPVTDPAAEQPDETAALVYPLSQEAVDQALAEQGLQLTHNSSDNTREGRSFYTYSNADETFGYNISTVNQDDATTLSIGLMLHPDDEAESSEGEEGEVQYEAAALTAFSQMAPQQLFQIARALHEQTEQIDSVEEGFTAYFSEKDQDANWKGEWTTRIGDFYFRVYTSYAIPDNTAESPFTIISLTVQQEPAYEQNIRLAIEQWRPQTASAAAAAEAVAAWLGAATDSADTPCLLIRGRLEELQELESLPETYAKVGVGAAGVGGYWQANLVDADGSLPVLLAPMYFSAEELAVERDHYILVYGYPDNATYVVLYSLTPGPAAE